MCAHRLQLTENFRPVTLAGHIKILSELQKEKKGYHISDYTTKRIDPDRKFSVRMDTEMRSN